jgi:hypothetical protein
MKKVFKNMIICIIISLVVQIGGLFYLDNSFLASSATIKSQKVVDSSTSNKTFVSKVKVPDNATTINVSYDASYVSYYLNDALYVVNTITGKSVNISSSNGVKISFYKWLPDRNRMLIAETQNRNLSLSYYDVAESQKSNVTDLLMISSASKVKEIEAAPLPNVIYIKVANSATYDSIYWVNIMKTRKKIITQTQNIGKIKVIPHEDKMVYEDADNNKVYATGTNDPLSFIGSTKSCLLEIDNNDQVYIGDVDSSGNIDKIYYGTLKGSWQTIQLNTPVSKAHLFVTASGKVYIDDNLKGTVTESQTGTVTTYSGIFVQLYSNGVASLSDGNLVKTPFK